MQLIVLNGLLMCLFLDTERLLILIMKLNSISWKIFPSHLESMTSITIQWLHQMLYIVKHAVYFKDKGEIFKPIEFQFHSKSVTVR